MGACVPKSDGRDLKGKEWVFLDGTPGTADRQVPRQSSFGQGTEEDEPTQVSWEERIYVSQTTLTCAMRHAPPALPRTSGRWLRDLREGGTETHQADAAWYSAMKTQGHSS